MNGFGRTDIGKLRKVNQDFIYFNNSSIGNLENLYIVADGIGGHNAGEVASQKSIEFFVEYIKNSKKTNEILDNLVSGINYSNSKVFKLSKTNPDYENMGTTFTASTIKNNKLYTVHIGDSRLYGVRNNKIEQITTDHTYANELFKGGKITKEQLEKSPEKNILTKSLGTNEKIEVDALFFEVLREDSFIICSDGLSNMLSNDEILKIINLNKNKENHIIVEQLINIANNKGGLDNIAVIFIK